MTGGIVALLALPPAIGQTAEVSTAPASDITGDELHSGVGVLGQNELREAVAMVERGISDCADRQLLSSGEVTDLLLDVRGALLRLQGLLHTN